MISLILDVLGLCRCRSASLFDGRPSLTMPAELQLRKMRNYFQNKVKDTAIVVRIQGTWPSIAATCICISVIAAFTFRAGGFLLGFRGSPGSHRARV
jgi:hypothetical protein